MLRETPSTAFSDSGSAPRSRAPKPPPTGKYLLRFRASTRGWVVRGSIMGAIHLVMANATGEMIRTDGEQFGVPGPALLHGEGTAIQEAAAGRRVNQAGRRTGNGSEVFARTGARQGTEEALRVGMFRLGEQGHGVALLNDLPPIHHRHAVAGF